MKTTTKSKIKEIVAEISGLSVELDIQDNSRFKEDLGLDSIDKLEIVMKIETTFYVNIPDSTLEDKLDKVSDIYTVLEDLGIEVTD